MSESIHFHYIFNFDDGAIKEFDVKLDRETLSLITKPASSCGSPAARSKLEEFAKCDGAPSWTELNHCKCPNCPLDEAKHKHCPVALNLADLIHSFKDAVSYEKTSLTIETERRSFMKEVSLQQGLGSLVGIYMTTSGCPILDKLRPMVRHHLPFANAEETQYRVLSMYLLAQYFLKKRGEPADWDLKKLPRIYDEIRIVNKAFCERLKSVQGEDAIPNAVVILDTFANSITFSIDKNLLNKTERLFFPSLDLPRED